jgi:hypothetical protein
VPRAKRANPRIAKQKNISADRSGRGPVHYD